MIQTPARIQFQSKSQLAIVLLIVIGLLFLIASIKIAAGFWASLFSQLSTALLVGGLWTGIYEIFMRRDFMRINDENRDLILSNICLNEGEQKLGLAEVYEYASEHDYNDLLENCQNLTIVLNDGRTWVSNHSEALRRRFEVLDKKTTFYFLHPDSEMIGVLAKKVGTTAEKLKEKIFETIAMIKHLSKENNSNENIKVYGHYYYNPQAVFQCDDIVILTPYYAARNRSVVPLFIFRDIGSKSYAHRIKEDIKDLKTDSVDIFGNVAPSE